MAARIFLFCLSSIVFAFACTRNYSENDLHGMWVGENEKVRIAFSFNPDNTCEFAYTKKGQKLIKMTGVFEVNFAKKPIPLTIRNIPQLNHPLHTIIEFKESDALRMAEFAPRWRLRPIAFNRDTEIIFRRSNIRQKITVDEY